jgi:hypothetical protein
MFPLLPMFSRAQVRLALWVLAGLLLAVGVALACNAINDWMDGIEQRGYDRARAETTAAALVASEQARAREADMARSVAQLEERHRAIQSDMARAGASARAELDRLRGLLAAHNDPRPGRSAQDPAAAGRADAAAAAAVVAGECAAQLVEVAEATDAIAARLRSLQSWATVVAQSSCVTSMTASSD